MYKHVHMQTHMCIYACAHVHRSTAFLEEPGNKKASAAVLNEPEDQSENHHPGLAVVLLKRLLKELSDMKEAETLVVPLVYVPIHAYISSELDWSILSCDVM